MTGRKECVDLLLTRRSIRRYREEEIPLDMIMRILDIARYAPSAKNSQPWEFVVVTDRAKLDKLSEIHVGARPLKRAPAAVVVVCDRSKSPTSYLMDCANATIYMMLAAHAYGVGTVWVQALRDQSVVREILGIPADKDPVAIIAMGWPAEDPPVRPRKPLEELVHINEYGKSYTGSK